MDILKRHISLVIAAVVTLVGTALFGFLLLSSGKKVDTQREKLERIKIDKKAVNDFRWALNESNRQMAKENLALAIKSYQQEFDKVAERYQPAEGEQLTPINCVDRLRQQCEVMRARLGTEGVEFSADTGKFTLNKYLDVTQLPKKDEIPKIMKQLQILDEIVAVVGRTGVDSLVSLSRDQEKLDMETKDGYKYCEYQIRIRGNADSIRRFANELINARFFFVIRNLSIGAEDLTKTMNTGSAAGTDSTRRTPVERSMEENRRSGRPRRDATAASTENTALYKENRLAFTDMAEITLDVTLDYIEFVEDKTSENMRDKKPVMAQ